MYDIPIDAERYHVNALTQAELAWGKATCARVLKRYPDLKKFVATTLAPLHLDQQGTDNLLQDITLAFCHTIKLSQAPKTKEQADKTIKAWLRSFLPFIAENLAITRYSHPVQFEPITLSCHYLATTTLSALTSTDMSELTEFETYYLLEYIGFFRVVRSSLALFSIGDDVHGLSLYRGALELLAKLILAEQFPDEYVSFKNFNAHLQIKKINGDPLPKEMTDYLQNEPNFKKNPENFLAYGWAKNTNGKRILSMRELIRVSLKDEINVPSLLQVASEFTHEDYAGVGYDYVSIRKAMIDHYYLLFKLLLSQAASDGLLSSKILKKLRHLQTLADPIYTGDVPLSAIETET